LSLSTNLRFEIVENDFEGFRTLAATMTLAAVLAVAVADKRRSSGAADVSSLALDGIAGSRA
jgi:uncharacterized protein with PhoU and TrkA domain